MDKHTENPQSNEAPQDPYESLRHLLLTHETLPGNYNFKFIVKNEEELVHQIKEVFKNAQPSFAYKHSSNGKYVTVNVQIFVQEVEVIINYYKIVGQIKGVMMM